MNQYFPTYINLFLILILVVSLIGLGLLIYAWINKKQEETKNRKKNIKHSYYECSKNC